MSAPPITAVVEPCYIAARYLQPTLRSVMSPVTFHWEILGVENCPSDRAQGVSGWIAPELPSNCRVWASPLLVKCSSHQDSGGFYPQLPSNGLGLRCVASGCPHERDQRTNNPRLCI